ncbi:MAG TPA: hypothetical protein VK691_06860 [Solirubrobacteraceae bacterium]|jgi:hypothetical protein|nr:hypothetical protein [Solirubrobacteraceae bacterium]
MNDRAIDLLRALRPNDAELVHEIFPEEYRAGLLTRLTNETHLAEQRGNVRQVRRQRGPLALGAIGIASIAAGTVAVVLLASGSAVNPPSADAVSFHIDPDGYILASVTDPFATQARLDRAFARQGLHVTIRLIPVSPGAVGRVVYMGVSNTHGAQIEPLRGGEHCTSNDADCAIGLRIPKGFTAKATIALGRPARPGERYGSAASAFANGEILHCSGLLGASVARALPVFSHDKLTVRWMEDIEVPTRHSGISSRSSSVAQPPESDYVWGADLSAPGRLVVQIESKPWPATPGAGADFNDGC